VLALLEPYDVEVPYWNWYVVELPFGSTEPVSAADDVALLDPLPVVTLGGFGVVVLWPANAVAGTMSASTAATIGTRSRRWSESMTKLTSTRIGARVIEPTPPKRSFDVHSD
jgi:hypothetical protein